MTVPKPESSFFGLFLLISKDWGGLAKVSLQGQSVRMTEVGQERVGQAVAAQSKYLWRIQGIGFLVGYPEKTDRLEQRQAAGKTPWPLFRLSGMVLCPCVFHLLFNS